jgi:hypothetical protein
MLQALRDIVATLHGDWIVAIATLGLGTITGWLAWETRRMASATMRLVQIDSEPQLRIKGMAVARSPHGADPNLVILQIQMLLWNPGRVLVQYRVDAFPTSISGNTAHSKVKFKSMEGVLHPTGEEIFRALPILMPVPQTYPVTGKASFDLAFWSLGRPERRVVGSCEIDIHPPGHDCPWVWANGPQYTV